MPDSDRIQLDLVTKFHGGELSGAIRSYEKLIDLHDQLSQRLSTPLRFGVVGLNETARRIDAMTARVKTSADAFKEALLKIGDPGAAAKVEGGARSPTQILAERQRMLDKLRKQAETAADAARRQEAFHAKTNFFGLPVNAVKANELQNASRAKLDQLNAEAARASAELTRAEDQQRTLVRAAKYQAPASGTPLSGVQERVKAAAQEVKETASAASAVDRLKVAYAQLAKESGFAAVKIGALFERAGVAVPEGKRLLTELHQKGRVVLSAGDESVAGEKGRAAAIPLQGQQHHLVRFLEGGTEEVKGLTAAEQKLSGATAVSGEGLKKQDKITKAKGQSLKAAAGSAADLAEEESSVAAASAQASSAIGVLRRQTDETGKKLNELSQTGLGTTALTKFTDEGEKVIHTEDLLAASSSRAAASENAYRTKIKQSGSDLSARLAVTNDSIASLQSEAQALSASGYAHTAQAARIQRLIAARTGERASIQGKIGALEAERQVAQDSLQAQVTQEERLARVRSVRSRFDRLTASAQQPSERADLLERRAAALKREADTMRALGVNEREERRVRADGNAAANEALRIRTLLTQQTESAQGRLQKEVFLEGNLAEVRRASARAANALADKSLTPGQQAAVHQTKANYLEGLAQAMEGQGQDEKAILRVRQESVRAATKAKALNSLDAIERQKAAQRSREAAMVTSGFNPAGYEAGDVKTVTKGGGAGGIIRETTSQYSKLSGTMQENVTVFQRTDAAGKVLETRFQSVNTQLKDLGRTGDFASRSFLHNTFVVAAWATSVATFQGVIGALQMGAKASLELERNTAILLNVFRYGTDEAYRLRDGVLELGAANGRSAQESLDAAVRFSRMGLTRSQVMEAVTISLKAANVAEISSAEAAEYLSAIMAGFKLQVRDLGIVLNELNTISNTYNVTNKDMLEGIARVGSLASQARLPLEELMGIIATGVGRTGRAGSEFGNAVKAMIVSISTPAIQEKLKLRFDFDVKDSAGEIKDMSTLLAELYLKYQQLGMAERQELLQRVGQKQQASRLAAVIDGYVQTQVLAIRAQRDLNSAERENASIRATMLSQLQSLGTEFQRAFLSLTASGQSSVVTNVVQNTVAVMTNALRLFSEFPGVAGLVITMLTVMALRTASLAVAMDAASGRGNFFTNTLKQVGNVMSTVATTMNVANRQLAASGTMLGGVARAGRSASAGLLSMTRGIPILGGIGRGISGLIKLSTFALGAFRSMIGGLVAFAAIEGLFALINYAVDKFKGGLTAAEQAAAALNRRIDESGRKASAYEQAARLFDTIGKAAASPLFSAEQGKLAAQGVAEIVYPNDLPHQQALKEELEMMFRQKDVLAIQHRLEGLKLEAMAEARKVREGELQDTQEALANDEKSLRAVRAMIKAKDQAGAPADAERQKEKELLEAIERHRTKQVSSYGLPEVETGENEFEKINQAYRSGREKGMDRFAGKLPAVFTESQELRDQVNLLRAKLSLEEKSAAAVEAEALTARDSASERVKGLEVRREELLKQRRLYEVRPLPGSNLPPENSHAYFQELRRRRADAEAEAASPGGRRREAVRSAIDQGIKSTDQQISTNQRLIGGMQEQLDLSRRLTDEKRKKVDMELRELEVQMRVAQATEEVTLAGRQARSDQAAGLVGRSESEKILNQSVRAIQSSYARADVSPTGQPLIQDAGLEGDQKALSALNRQAQIRENLLRLQQNEATLLERKGQLEAEISNEKLKQTLEASKALLLASREDQLQAALTTRFARDRGRGFSVNDFQFLSQGTRQNIERFTPNLAPAALNLPLEELKRESNLLAGNFDSLSGAIKAVVASLGGLNPQQAAADFAGAPSAPPPAQPSPINLQIASVNVSLAEQGAALVGEFQNTVKGYIDPQIVELRQLINSLTVPRPAVTNAGAR